MLQKVKSSNLHSLGYDPVTQEMSVLFNHTACKGAGCVACDGKGHTGERYIYSDVPAEKYAAVRDSESIGAAFGKEIKQWKHPDTGEGFKFTKRQA
jgi:hypothetical protein